MEKQLPKNWVETSPKEISKLLRGVSYGKTDAYQEEFENSCLILRGGNIQDGKIVEGNDNVYVDLSLIKEDQLLQEADVVIVGSTGSKQLIGKAATSLESFENVSFGAFLMAIRANENLNKWYFSYYFQTDFYRESIRNLAGGVNINNIRKEYIENLYFPLPPLAEQNRIVEKLDALFAQLETIKTSMAKVPLLLKDFRQQVLTQAVTGKLTEEWRKGEELESSEELIQSIIERRVKSFELKCKLAKEKGERKPTKILLDKLPEIEPINIELPSNWFQTNVHFLSFVTKLAGFEYTEHFDLKEEGEIPVVRAQNVQMGRFDDKNRLYMSKKTSDFLVRSQLHGREILMVFIGAGTGNVCMAPKNERWHLAPNVAKIDVDGINTEYLYLYLQSPLGVENVLSRVKATAQPSLSMETIREIIALVPPLKEQQEIVSRVESLFAKAEAIEKQYESLKAKIESLPQAILHKAFKGELTEQLDSDGDARELLREIEGLKAVSGKTLKSKKTKSLAKKV